MFRKTPVVMNHNCNLCFYSFWDQICSIMLSRSILGMYLVVLIIPIVEWLIQYLSIDILISLVTYIQERVREKFSGLSVNVICYTLLIACGLFILGSMLYFRTVASLAKFQCGRPPVGRLTVAYRFIWQDAYDNEKVISRTQQLFPDKKLIQFYYTGYQILGIMGVAYGAILSEGDDPDNATKDLVTKHNFKLFVTPAIENAVHISCPILSPLSLVSYYVVLQTIYPRLFKYCQRRCLSAFPVIEILDKNEVKLLAPLSHQNDFVVTEAEDLFLTNDLDSDYQSSNGYSSGSSSKSSSKSVSSGYSSSPSSSKTYVTRHSQISKIK